MKKYLKKLMSHSVFRKTLYLYAISMMVLTLLLLLAAFWTTNTRVRDRNISTSKQLLLQLVSSTDRARTDVGNLLSVISGDARTNSVTNGTIQNKSETYRLFLLLSEWKGYYSYIENISVLNLNTQICVQAVGSERTSQDTLEAATEMVANGEYLLCRDICVVDKEKNVISFMQYLPYRNSAVLIDVDAELFQYSISDETDSPRTAYMLDGEGKPITEATRGTVNGLPIAEYLWDLIEKNEFTDSYLVYDDSKNHQIVFVCKSQNTGWMFCDIQSYGFFYQDLKKIALIFLILLLVFFAVTVITSMVFLQKMQKPLQKIVQRARGAEDEDPMNNEDEWMYLDKAIAKITREQYIHDNYINSQYLKNMMLGYGMPFLLPHEKLQMLRKKYESPYFAVMLIKIQSPHSDAENQREENSMYRFMVCNLADEIFGEKYQCKAVELREDTVGILLMLEDSELSDDYQECFRQMKTFAKDAIGIQLSGSVGNVVASQKEVFESCQKAEQYEKVSSLIGKEELIDSNQISNTNYQEKNQKLVESMREYTKMNYCDPDLSLKSISQKFHLSTSYVGKIFKSIQGVSYSSYLTEYRLEESKILLSETRKSVNEIASGLGFTSATYFTTVFKNQYGMTPTAFRNERNLSKTVGED
ncbi:MAG: helix-turn-helix domain-containing protein [Fusicatenibacter sp.]